MDRVQASAYDSIMFQRCLSIALALSILLCPVYCDAEVAHSSCLLANESPVEHHHEATCDSHACFCSSVSVPSQSTTHLSIAAASICPDAIPSATTLEVDANTCGLLTLSGEITPPLIGQGRFVTLLI